MTFSKNTKSIFKEFLIHIFFIIFVTDYLRTIFFIFITISNVSL